MQLDPSTKKTGDRIAIFLSPIVDLSRTPYIAYAVLITIHIVDGQIMSDPILVPVTSPEIHVNPKQILKIPIHPYPSLLLKESAFECHTGWGTLLQIWFATLTLSTVLSSTNLNEPTYKSSWLPSGTQTWQWKITYKSRFQSENHL